MFKKQAIKRFLLILILLFLILSFFFIFWLYFFIIPNLPSTDKIKNYKPAEQTKFYDRNNKLLYEIGEEKREYIKIDQIPNNIKNAFIAAEDRTFYSNHGIDLIGLARASIFAIPNFLSGKRVSGASTISQQLIKNLLLTNERTLIRKLKEFILSYKLNKEFSKDLILEVYLNHIYLGSSAYGIKSAAEIYFNKDINKITLSEAALLATLPKAPSLINPFKNFARSMERRDWILGRMFEDKYIDERELKESLTDIPKLNNNKKNNYVGQISSWFAKDQITKAFNIEKDKIIKGGFNVYTTIDYDLQEIVQKTLDKHIIKLNQSLGYVNEFGRISDLTKWDLELKKINAESENNLEMAVVLEFFDDYLKIGLKNKLYGIIKTQNLKWILQNQEKNKKIKDIILIGDILQVKQIENSNEYLLEPTVKINGAVVAINPETGEILALSGGAFDVAGNLNRALSKRQIGSTIKPLLYAYAFDHGIKPNDIFMDSYISYNLEDGISWIPKNVDNKYLGPVTVRTALLGSINTVTIRILEKIKLAGFVNVLRKLELNDPSDINLSIALGSIESSLLNLVRAYSIFLNNGYLKDLCLVKSFISSDVSSDQPILLTGIHSDSYSKEKIDNHNNEESNIIEEEVDLISEKKPIISEQSLYQALYILQNHISARKMKDLNIFGKTGTSNDGIDLWFVGSTKSLMIGIFIGYDIPQKTNYTGQIATMPVYLDIMSEIKNTLKKEDFLVPENIKYLKIDAKTGKKTAKNTGYIYEAFKLKDEVLDEFDDDESGF